MNYHFAMSFQVFDVLTEVWLKIYAKRLHFGESESARRLGSLPKIMEWAPKPFWRLLKW